MWIILRTNKDLWDECDLHLILKKEVLSQENVKTDYYDNNFEIILEYHCKVRS